MIGEEIVIAEHPGVATESDSAVQLRQAESETVKILAKATLMISCSLGFAGFVLTFIAIAQNVGNSHGDSFARDLRIGTFFLASALICAVISIAASKIAESS